MSVQKIPVDDTARPARSTPRRLSRQIEDWSVSVMALALRARPIEVFLENQRFAELINDLVGVAREASEIGVRVLVGTEPLAARFVDVVAGRGVQPVIDVIESKSLTAENAEIAERKPEKEEIPSADVGRIKGAALGVRLKGGCFDRHELLGVVHGETEDEVRAAVRERWPKAEIDLEWLTGPQAADRDHRARNVKERLPSPRRNAPAPAEQSPPAVAPNASVADPIGSPPVEELDLPRRLIRDLKKAGWKTVAEIDVAAGRSKASPFTAEDAQRIEEAIARLAPPPGVSLNPNGTLREIVVDGVGHKDGQEIVFDKNGTHTRPKDGKEPPSDPAPPPADDDDQLEAAAIGGDAEARKALAAKRRAELAKELPASRRGLLDDPTVDDFGVFMRHGSIVIPMPKSVRGCVATIYLARGNDGLWYEGAHWKTPKSQGGHLPSVRTSAQHRTKAALIANVCDMLRAAFKAERYIAAMKNVVAFAAIESRKADAASVVDEPPDPTDETAEAVASLEAVEPDVAAAIGDWREIAVEDMGLTEQLSERARGYFKCRTAGELAELPRRKMLPPWKPFEFSAFKSAVDKVKATGIHEPPKSDLVLWSICRSDGDGKPPRLITHVYAPTAAAAIATDIGLKPEHAGKVFTVARHGGDLAKVEARHSPEDVIRGVLARLEDHTGKAIYEYSDRPIVGLGLEVPDQVVDLLARDHVKRVDDLFNRIIDDGRELASIPGMTDQRAALFAEALADHFHTWASLQTPAAEKPKRKPSKAATARA